MEKKLFSDRELAYFFKILEKMLNNNIIDQKLYQDISYRVISYEYHNE